MINEILDFFKTVFSGSGFFSLGCNVWNSLIAYAFDMLQTNPKSLADGELWDEAYRIFLALQILGATLVSVFFMINFFKETTDIKHGMTMEASIQFFIKLALVDAVFLNLTNILVFLIEIEQAFFGIIVPEDAASLVIRVGDDWEMSGSGLIFGNLFGLVFLFICLGGAVITLWTVYRVFLKLFFYMAVAPLALSTYAGPHEIGHTGSSWVRTFLCALFEMTGIMLMMRLGTILINAGGLFPTASEDILGGMLGSQGWEGLQAILGILIITGWKVFMDSCAVFLFLGSGRGAYDTQETISKMLGAATIEKASGSVSYGQNGSSSTSYDRLQRSLMDANEVAQMDKDSCIILPFASKPIIDKKYKPFHDPSYLKAKKYGPYTHPVEIFRDKNGNLHTVNHQEKFYFPDEGLQAKIRDDLKEGKSSGMLFELSEDEFCSLDLDDPKLNGPQGNLFLLQQLKKLEDDSATLKLQNAVNEKMNSVIYDTSDNTSSLEADEESAAETISVYDVRQSWDLSGNLEDVIRRYILELSEDEVSNITEAMNRHIPEKKIKDCLTLPPEKLCLMLQFYMKQAN